MCNDEHTQDCEPINESGNNQEEEYLREILMACQHVLTTDQFKQLEYRLGVTYANQD